MSIPIAAKDTIFGYEPLTALIVVVIICLLVWLLIKLISMIG